MREPSDPNPMPYGIRLFFGPPTVRRWFVTTFELEPLLVRVADWLARHLPKPKENR